MHTLSNILAIIGCFFVFIAGLGVLRLPDIFMRMHASTKASSLGLGLILLAIIFRFPELPAVIKCLLIIVFTFITIPVASHMIGRAAYMHKSKLWNRTVLDELKGKYATDHSRLDS